MIFSPIWGEKWRRSEHAHASYPGLFFSLARVKPLYGVGRKESSGTGLLSVLSGHATPPSVSDGQVLILCVYKGEWSLAKHCTLNVSSGVKNGIFVKLYSLTPSAFKLSPITNTFQDFFFPLKTAFQLY